MDWRSPRDAIMAPPGTPGAATIVIPSIMMNPMNIPKSYGMPCMIMSARAHAVILRVLPDMWIVEQRGITKPATSSETPLRRVCWRVTGMVAAEDCVPRAVKYAGSMFQSSLNGFFLVSPPAITNWMIRIPMWMMNMIPMIFMKTVRIENT